MKTTGFITIIFIAALFCTCRQQSLSPHAYVKWVRSEENGLRLAKKIGNYDFTLQYKPAEYVVLDRYKSDTISRKKVEQELPDYTGLQYYTLSISSESDMDLLKADIDKEGDYYSRLEYFTSYAQDDISLVENGDTLHCALYHFERNYGLSPNVDIVLGFEKTDHFSSADKQFIYHDQVFGTGPVQFSIASSSINHIPTVSYVKN